MKAIDFVAENIMGFGRGYCRGNYGSGTISTNYTRFSFWCENCGETREGGTLIPCPNFPFPEFSIIELMRKLGKLGHPIHLRHDPLRPSHNFTIIMDNSRICDTDEPFEALCEYLQRYFEAMEA